MNSIISSAQHYVQESLGLPLTPRGEWSGQDSLPYFLRDAFDIELAELAGVLVVLAADRAPAQRSLAELRDRLARIRSAAGHPVVYVTDALASYERKRLIEQKVPFVVPGKQLYLPDAGLDLREYFRPPPPAAQRLSPSTQAILISALLQPQWKADWHPAETGLALGYTAMTLSRATRELVATGLAQVRKEGRSQHLAMPYSADETWARAAPFLRSPVQRTVWTDRLPVGARLAGLSALAARSMLSEPPRPVHAVSRTEWQSLKATVEEVPHALPQAWECQVWAYSTALEPGSPTVDPLSLILSLRDMPDERVQGAIEALTEQLPW